MHIPDGILSPAVWSASAAISAAVLAGSVRHSRRQLDYRAVPVMGVMSAFIFASQMVNFPILGAAASGHLIGGALAALLFGFWPATLIMTVVVAIQAIVFQDGGITALGTNVLNMAILAPFFAIVVHKLVSRLSFLPKSAAAFVSAWSSVVLVSLAASLQLALSGVVALGDAAAALLFWHTWIGIGEGLITAVVLPIALRSSFYLPGKESVRL